MWTGQLTVKELLNSTSSVLVVKKDTIVHWNDDAVTFSVVNMWILADGK